tara:strand:+ start:10045 stop:11058 length:1014 start_codon:yes stop_codon:yes gene_type:complete
MPLNVSTGTLGDLAPAAGAFPANHAYFVKEFIEIANPELVYEQFGTPKPIPRNTSNEITFQKVLKLATLEGSPLTEGVTPTEQTFQMVRFSAAVSQYGGYARVTDRLHEESINGVTSEFNKRIGEQAGETMNKVVRDGLLGGANVRRRGGVATIDAITTAGVGADDFDFMFQAFKIEKVKAISPMTKGSPNTGTLPVREAYYMVCAVEAIPYLEALDDGLGNKFISVEKYAGQFMPRENEHGRFKNFVFITDTESYLVDNAAATPQSINKALVFGKGAYHYTTIANSDIELIIKPLGSSGDLDALNQRSSIGWKAKKAAVIVQPTYMFRYEFSIGAA